MAITTSAGEKRDESTVDTSQAEKFKQSVEYQCLTKGHLWPDEVRPGETSILCKRCRKAEIEIDGEEDEE